ncbi:MAG: type I secretion system permease/ATPase [Sphingomonadales bacterium]|nr:type I secretion system permease/ATPase [Sphingomonadales bacterium]MBU3992740.1 type I secretion system permease/ATPase [Alphaproteobacteria bacterium]
MTNAADQGRAGMPAGLRFGLARSAELLGALPGGRRVLGTVVGMSAALNVLLLSGSIFMLLVYDEVLPGHSLPSLVGLVALLVVAYAFQAALEHLRHRVSGAAGEMLGGALSDRVFALVLQAELARAGRDAAQPVRDLDTLRAFFAGPGPMAVLDLPWMLLFLGVLFAFHWMLGLACLAGAAILVGLTIATDRMTARQIEAATRSGADRFSFIEACRRNAEVIRALGMQGAILGGWQRISVGHAYQNDAASERLSAMRTFSKTFRLLLQSLILATGAWLVIAGEASGGVIIAASILSSRALAPIDAAIGNWRGLIAARQAWNRLADRFDAAPLPPARTGLPRPARELCAESLAAVVPGTQTVLFRDIAFRLGAGEALAVVGASGSGKSSLARALVGLLEPARGAVRLDGATLDQWDADSAGAFIGYLPQDIELFDGTIAQNIARFAPDAASAEVVAAAGHAGVHELIVRLPQGYDTVIGPAGRNLSAGQRQRIALARALFRDPFLIVLDEPNSNLDASGDAALARAIGGARARGAIVIVVAHRPSALAGIDKLLWLDAGVTRALGAKAEILPRLTGGAQPPDPGRNPPRIHAVEEARA